MIKRKPILNPILSISNTDLMIQKNLIDLKLKNKNEFLKKKTKSLTQLKSLSKIPSYKKLYFNKLRSHKYLNLDLITNEIKLSNGVTLLENGSIKKENKFRSTFHNENKYEKMTKDDYNKLIKNGGFNKIRDIQESSIYFSEDSEKTFTTKNSSEKKIIPKNSLKKPITPFLFIKRTKQEIKKKILKFEKKKILNDSKKTHFSQNNDINCFTDYKTLFNKKRKKNFAIESVQIIEKGLELKDIFNLNIIKNDINKNNSFYKKIVKPGKLPKKKSFYQRKHRFYNTLTNLKENIKEKKFII